MDDGDAYSLVVSARSLRKSRRSPTVGFFKLKTRSFEIQ
jgi:hypothetical protein